MSPGRNAYRAHPPDSPALILLDLHMPKVDGVEVLRTIKNDPVLKTIPVVVLSSSREEDHRIKGSGLGATGYMVKAVDFTSFVEVVRLVGCSLAIVGEPPKPTDQ